MIILHLIATPRAESSNTLRISNVLLDNIEQHVPDRHMMTLDLFHHDVPAMAGNRIESKYILMRGGELQPDMRTTWDDIESAIHRFLLADIYVVSAPMWNFTIPYALKYYIDTIVQPGYLFKYKEDGTPIGLATDKKMVVVRTTGGDYSENSPLHALDFHEPYLRGIFGFCGITDIHFITAGLMDVTPELREQRIKQAIEEQVPVAVNHILPI